MNINNYKYFIITSLIALTFTTNTVNAEYKTLQCKEYANKYWDINALKKYCPSINGNDAWIISNFTFDKNTLLNTGSTSVDVNVKRCPKYKTEQYSGTAKKDGGMIRFEAESSNGQRYSKFVGILSKDLNQIKYCEYI